MDKTPPPNLASLALKDRFVNLVGIEFVEGGTGWATVRMQVRDEHLNFMGGCHGGVIFTLADTAFGIASNSQGVMSVGINAHISYSVAVHAGDWLTASAAEHTRSHRLATYRVDVTRGDGKTVAVFTGSVYVTGKHLSQ